MKCSIEGTVAEVCTPIQGVERRGYPQDGKIQMDFVKYEKYGTLYVFSMVFFVQLLDMLQSC